MNIMYLVLGDWSNDGHGKSENVLLESNVDVSTVQKAYKDSCKLTGVSFNDNENYTGVEHSWEEVDDYHICTAYEKSNIPTEAYKILETFGLTKKLLRTFDEEIDMRSKELSKEGFVNLWIWFVKLSNPSIELYVVKDNTPYINGWWNKELNVQFGYGLYL